MLKPSVIGLVDLTGEEQPRPCSIDSNWTHSPLVFKTAALSDDMPLTAGKKNKWQVTYPKAGVQVSDINGRGMQFAYGPV